MDIGICCEKCGYWFHYDCEQIGIADQRIYENTESVYTCMACTFDNQGDGLDESLVTDNRHIQESDSVNNIEETIHLNGGNMNSDETYRKEGYELGLFLLVNKNKDFLLPKNNQDSLQNIIMPLFEL